MLNYIIVGATYAFAAAVQPGPLLTYIVSQTLSRGWRRTLPASFAPVISDVPIILLVLLVLSTIPPKIVQFLHFAGALFLFYLAAAAFRNWLNYDPKGKLEDGAGHKTLFKAVLVNILNPNPYIGWSLVMGPLFLKGYRETPVNGIALIIGFYATMVVTLAAIIFLFAFARNLGPRVSRVMIALSVIGLACFGLYQLWLGITAI